MISLALSPLHRKPEHNCDQRYGSERYHSRFEFELKNTVVSTVIASQVLNISATDLDCSRRTTLFIPMHTNITIREFSARLPTITIFCTSDNCLVLLEELTNGEHQVGPSAREIDII